MGFMKYKLRLTSMVEILLDCMNSPSLFTLLVRMRVGDIIMAWVHAMNGIHTHHCSCDSINGCILTLYFSDV